MSLNQSVERYEFDQFWIDPVKRLLYRGEQPVTIAPKAFDVLLILLENCAQVVERDDLMKRLWPDTFVEDINLNVHISGLRKALGENLNDHRYIVTVPRRGYRFVAEVRKINRQELNGVDAESINNHFRQNGTAVHQLVDNPLPALPVEVLENPPGFFKKHLRLLAFSASLLVVISAIIFLWSVNRRNLSSANPTAKSIAVLPFRQLSPGDDEYIGLGMADALITKLGNLRQLTVRPTSAIIQYHETPMDIAATGRELGVDLLLEGKIQRSDQRIRVTVQLLHSPDGTTLWTESFDESYTNIFAVQDSISRRVAESMSVKLDTKEKGLLAKHYTENTEAHRAYIKGRFFWNKRSGEGLRKALDYFNQAIELDPAYALAYSGLADSYVLLSIYSQAPYTNTLPRAKAAALKALEIDHTLAEAHTSLAYAKLHSDWDWTGAEEQFKLALELNPNYATAHHWYGELLILQGRKEEAIAAIERALELDSLSVIINSDFAWILYYGREYDRTIAQARRVFELDPDFPPTHKWMAMAYTQKGMYREALAEFQQHNLDKQFAPQLAYVLGVAQKRRQAMEILSKLLPFVNQRPKLSYPIAGIYAGLGDKEQTLRWLEKAFAEKHELLIYLKVEQKFDFVRSEPRFQNLLRGIGLQN